MFNKIIQEIKTPLFDEVLIEEYDNQNKDNRDMEIKMIITPSKNYFKVYPYFKHYKDRLFLRLKSAQKYIKYIQIKGRK